VVIFLVAILLTVSLSSAQLKIFKNTEKRPYAIPEKVFSSRFVVGDTSDEARKEVLSKGCEISSELEDVLIVKCPKSVTSLKSGKRERIFSAMVLQDVNGKEFQPRDIFDSDAINVPAVHELGYTGKNTIVALIDSGIDYNHPNLADSYAGGYDFLANDNDPFYDLGCGFFCGHATAMAGIITSNGDKISDEDEIGPFTKGVAPDAKIIVGKVCGEIEEDGISFFGCPEGAIIAALQWAAKGIDGVKSTGDEPAVISMSLGSAETWISSNCNDDLLAREVNKVGRTVPVVVSAGNFPFGVSSPACAKNAIAAGAVGGGADWYNTITDFSGRGYPMKNHGVLAPGVDVITTFPENSYVIISGTSPSAPYVAGVIALMKEKNPRQTVNSARTAIFRSAVDLPGSSFVSEEHSFEQGFGRIDALGAINRI